MLRGVGDNDPQVITANRRAPDERIPNTHTRSVRLEARFCALNRLNFLAKALDLILILNGLTKQIFWINRERSPTRASRVCSLGLLFAKNVSDQHFLLDEIGYEVRTIVPRI